ncbi:MAG: hypothetical protein IKA05_00995 [Clostridia bacterium]|nr:hypothetical protein [Clostridia bacterium]
MTNPMDRMNLHSDKTKKTMLITLGAVGGVTALGVAAAAVWNSRQLRMSRAVKRTGKVLYQVGTAMRNVSGVE